jgi:hypothetical protein
MTPAEKGQLLQRISPAPAYVRSHRDEFDRQIGGNEGS